ncbi:hypothetical protein EXT68_06550 [Pectobacterium parmentieri]|uniref:Prophage protein n=1 Tax=Pectobacterium parmentieri TaxID=1905730 RepID=A0A0H3I7Z2_PECPM|nr:hypothetical protein [Pectobacterium parmentieri]AFI91633.1 Hypothetical protein W5S_3563 [Pectobacterium parmentieri]MBI0471251.1 hypothetical protein [Pectobacterium parmentieri]MBI0493863.1 hypothetical protein [Pectobacterium parmentieri]MBI0554715.1 hypothetical protein [Pectobacterium parmentieri]MBI0568129.1 hypothetical protein [Pectobacterium parmentieri]
MEKKNRPLQAANSDIRTFNITPTTSTIQPFKRTPKKHRARIYMLRTGVEGWTENDILRYCRLSSGRNYASEIERRLDIQLERIDEKNPDGIGTHLRYRFVSRGDVIRVIQLVNRNAAAGGYQGLSQPEITDILNLYPGNLTAA